LGEFGGEGEKNNANRKVKIRLYIIKLMRRFDTIRARNGKNNMNSSVMKREKAFWKEKNEDESRMGKDI
jgi:hypothetical protein